MYREWLESCEAEKSSTCGSLDLWPEVWLELQHSLAGSIHQLHLIRMSHHIIRECLEHKHSENNS